MAYSMQYTETALSFDTIRERLANHAATEGAREKLLALSPTLSEAENKAWQQQTTEARRVIEALGTPPVTTLAALEKLVATLKAEGLLSPSELLGLTQFLAAVRRMKAYLQRGAYLEVAMTTWEQGLVELPELADEIERCIRGEAVDNQASKTLFSLRKKAETLRGQIKMRLHSMLSKNPKWFSDTLVVSRGDRLALPVRREYRNQVTGTVLDVSASGSTCFIEPNAVGKLQQELQLAVLEAENEERRILYQLTEMAREALPTLIGDKEMLETLDFAFAKGKLSLAMRAVQPEMTMRRNLRLRQARHPLLDEESCVPMDMEMSPEQRGILITGPNTGGKTVALKTVGLLILMAQSGLHVPAAEALLPMCGEVLCDIGDGQSISENLSTFSAHMTNVLGILQRCDQQSLVLLDELGSGTDPNEGMGIAVAILEELRGRGCLLVATTHYPEVKEYAKQADGFCNARMAFDRESLRPLYRLELGEAGESCALYIAERLGFPQGLLERAHQAAYAGEGQQRETPAAISFSEAQTVPQTLHAPRLQAVKAMPAQSERAKGFQLGDAVLILPGEERGLVYAPADARGEVGVQVRGEKRRVPYKRLRLHLAAGELYPEDYDFSVVFDSVENRKARHKLDKGHHPDIQVKYEKT